MDTRTHSHGESPLRRTAHEVAAAVAAEWLLEPALLFSKVRNKRVWSARRELWWRLAKLGFGTSEMGLLFDRDHSTIGAGIKKRRAEEKQKRRDVKGAAR